ncbi:MAG: UTRA domain-containing protein [Betaproteobacteria bacterium]|nr:UTRA domain-containing protein [Betaproteobacteria bacterium]
MPASSTRRQRKPWVCAVRIAWIGQRSEAVPVGAQEAARLRMNAGACALRVRRYYCDDMDRLLEVPDTLHAGDCFAYEMRLRRD